MVTDDLVSDENLISTTLQRSTFDEGSTVRVELYSIDEGTYDYFNTLVDVLQSSGMNSATPFNPTSNVSNNALGYFGAWAVSSMEVQL